MRLKFEKLMDSEVPQLVFKNKLVLADQKIQEQLRNNSFENSVGQVYLVGGGPGDRTSYAKGSSSNVSM